MTHTARKRPRRPKVFGERIEDLLPAMAAICSGEQILAAEPALGRRQDMLSLSLTLPPSAGGPVRRALLRSEADILRHQADVVGARAPAARCRHCRESAAMVAVAEQLQRVARALGVSGTTTAERAILLGQLTAPPSCRCCARP